MPPKKKSEQLEQPTLFGGSQQDILRSLNITHVGRHILLHSQDLYGEGNIPKGEETLLQQYSIISLNTDMATAVIAYDEKCITKGCDKFCDYPLTDNDEGQIDNYKMASLTDDHELFNFHLGRANKKVNELKVMKRKRDEEEKIAATNNVSDIERKLSDGVDPYLIMIGEFRSTGPLSVHTIQEGDNKGKTSKN
jgi:hypothetical protein